MVLVPSVGAVSRIREIRLLNFQFARVYFAWRSERLTRYLWDVVHIIDADPAGKGFENVSFAKTKEERP